MTPTTQDTQQKKQSEAIHGEPQAAPRQATESSTAGQPETRTAEFLFGIAGSPEGVKKIERNVPADEPPPLPPNSELKEIGKRVARYDGPFKVSGSARYSSDIHLPGMLYARFVNSTVPHAKVVSIDTSAAERHPDVRAVHVLQNLLGQAELLDKSKEVPSPYPIVRYVGQPLAAVAATTPQAALEAARLVKVQYEPMPFVVDPDSAREPGAPPVFPGPAVEQDFGAPGGPPPNLPQKGNTRGPNMGFAGPRGDIEKGFAASSAIVEAEYRTQVQTNSPLETHGAVVDWKPDGLTVYASSQNLKVLRDGLAQILQLPRTKVHVIMEYMGGGFGAKLFASNVEPVAAYLSKKAGSPVRLFCDRKEEQWATGNRPGAHIYVKAGADKEGKLQALKWVSYGAGGVGSGNAGTAGAAQSLYACPNVHTEEYDVFTNAGPGSAMRAPGHPPALFALDQTMDALAEKLGLDVLDFMERNDTSRERREERRIGREKFGWAQKRRKPGSDPGPVKRGVGVAQSIWYRLADMDSACEIRIHQDGSVEAVSAVQDLGTGIRTVMAQVVAEELGLQPHAITIRIGDTQFPPGPPSGGSMTTSSLTPAVRNAAFKVRELFLKEVAAAWGVPATSLVAADGKVTSNAGRSASFKQAAAAMRTGSVSATARRSPEYGPPGMLLLGGVQFAEVAVDTETGVIRVEHFVAVHDCGRPMNILGLESQVNGGILQGISYALYEDRRFDRNTGIMVNPNLEEYKIIGAKDIPRIEVYFLEDYLARSSTDAAGIAEPATVPVSAAVANAVYNALGVRMYELPMTPARVLAALGKVKQQGPQQARLWPAGKEEGVE
jgi:xanthine dehydrogenase YagR molybdenum-binding subunit